jgi:hypothetical protein
MRRRTTWTNRDLAVIVISATAAQTRFIWECSR